MKKRILIIIGVCMFSLLTIFGSKVIYINNNPKLVVSHPRYKYGFKNAEEIEAVSDVIVKVKALGESKQFLKYEIKKDIPVFGYTITKVEIVKVYKSSKLSEKQVIDIVEPSYYFNYNNSILEDRYFVTVENYKPLEKNKQYILFLVENTINHQDPNRRGCYEAIQNQYGKYLVSDKVNESTDINSLTVEDYDIYRSQPNYERLFLDVIKKYK